MTIVHRGLKVKVIGQANAVRMTLIEGSLFSSSIMLANLSQKVFQTQSFLVAVDRRQPVFDAAALTV